MKAYIYCRISTDHGGSDKVQIDECIEYCKKNDWEIKHVYNHVKSSRNMQNKELIDTIVNEMKSGDILVVHSICRFSRNMFLGLQVLDALVARGVKIYSVDDKVGYSDIHDRFRFRQIMNCAELETDKISHRVKQSFTGKKKTNTKRCREKESSKVSKKRKYNDSTVNTFLRGPLDTYDDIIGHDFTNEK